MDIAERVERMRENRIVIILGLTALVTGANNFVVSLLLPKIAEEFKMSIAAASIVIPYYMIPYGLMQAVYGVISDRVGKLKVMKILAIGFFAGNVGCLLTASFNQLLVYRFIAGFFAAGTISLPLAYIGDNFLEQERPKYVARFLSLIFTGQALSSLIGGVFMDYLNWRILFGVLAAISLTGMIFLFTLPNDPARGNGNLFEQIKPALISRLGLALYAISFFTGFFILGFYGFLGSYMSKILGLNSTYSGLIMMVYGMACILGSVLLGALSKKFSLYNFMFWGCSLFTLCVMAILVFESVAVTAVAMFIIGIGYIFLQSSTATLAFDIAPEAKGLPSAIVGMTLFGGGGLGSAVGGPILDSWGFHTLFLFFALGILGLAVYTYYLFKVNSCHRLAVEN